MWAGGQPLFTAGKGQPREVRFTEGMSSSATFSPGPCRRQVGAPGQGALHRGKVEHPTWWPDSMEVPPSEEAAGRGGRSRCPGMRGSEAQVRASEIRGQEQRPRKHGDKGPGTPLGVHPGFLALWLPLPGPRRCPRTSAPSLVWLRSQDPGHGPSCSAAGTECPPLAQA